MAPSRGKGKARATNRHNGASARRTTRASRSTADEADGVYADMLAEVAVTDPVDEHSDRPLKKRRVASKATPTNAKTENEGEDVKHSPATGRRQQIIDDMSGSDEDESELEFEDVDLGEPDASGAVDDDGPEDGIIDVSVTIGEGPRRQPHTKRKPVSTVEKKHRLLVHKAHIICLLGHCVIVNSRCNNSKVHQHLRPLLSKKVVAFLNPKATDSQFRQTTTLIDGLQQASEAFRGHFKVNASGMRRAQWANDASDADITDAMDHHDFVTAARKLEGSQDTGNQLFCALLRAVGVEARLVCSLQPLPFTNSSAKSGTPQKITKPTVFARLPAAETDTEDSAVNTSSTIGKVPSARRRLGQPAFLPDPPQSHNSPQPKKKVQKLTHPIFWTEVFNHAQQKWIAVDPLVTHTVNKASHLEPSVSYPLNQLSYAIAFESDGVAKDVTRRYARAFNAKTRRHRVESTENGATWLKKCLRFLRRRGGALDRDQVEDAELVQREAREGLPGNVLDFKDHPYYALERHIRRHEVIHPRREVGKVNAGTAAKPRMEIVFRREDVLVCRSADKWYRLGRVIKQGEVGVKRVPARRLQRARSMSQDGEEPTTPLYSAAQTELYVPPPVVRGKVPRNAYGNLDIYVPSMVPAGGTHVRHPLAKEAARALRVDCVDAVTGFSFKGRQGTAVTDGVVIATEHVDAVHAAIESLGYDKVEKESMERSAVALNMWKKFVIGLRIRERVAGYGGVDGAEEIAEGVADEDEETAGGFIPSSGEVEAALPTAGRFSLVELSTPAKSKSKGKQKMLDDESEEEAEFSDDAGSEFDDNTTNDKPSRTTSNRRRIVEDDSEEDNAVDSELASPPPVKSPDNRDEGFIDDIAMEEGGGFVADDDDGGGFVTDTPSDKGGSGFIAGGEDTGVLDDLTVGHNMVDAGTPHIMDFANTNAMSTDLMDGVEENETDQDTTTLNMLDSTNQHDILTETAPRDPMDVDIQLPGTDATPKTATAPALLEKATEADGNESDLGSMLSHDPEDEDAEPDWLESD